MTREALEKMLREMYGINNHKELDKAIANSPKVDIGIMTKRGVENGTRIAQV